MSRPGEQLGGTPVGPPGAGIQVGGGQVDARFAVGEEQRPFRTSPRRPAVTSTLIGARTVEQLRANLASLEVTLAPGQLVALDEPSTPSLDFPAAITAGPGPMLGFGGATVDGIELPVWPLLLTSSARY